MSKSDIANVSFDIAPDKWTVVSPSVVGISKIIDGSKNTSIEIDFDEAIIVDLGEVLNLKGFSYMPKVNVQASNILKYDFFVSLDNQNWHKMKSNAIFNNIKNNPIVQNVPFNKAVDARYLKIRPTELTNKADKYSIAELSVITQ